MVYTVRHGRLVLKDFVERFMAGEERASEDEV